MAQIQPDIVNKQADTAYKLAMASEPFKMVAAIVGATAAIFATRGVGLYWGRGH